MDENELWNGISINATKDDIVKLFPARIGDNPIKLGFETISGVDFYVTWHNSREKGSSVILTSAGFRKNDNLVSATKRLILLLQSKYGRGHARFESKGVIRKLWSRRWVFIEITSINDGNLPTVSIEYRRTKNTESSNWIAERARDLTLI